MPFGLTNAPAVFQNWLNDIFRDLLDRGVLVYLDDILVYAKTREEHDAILTEVLKRMKENSLFARRDKCVFLADEVEYLGHIVSTNGVKMDKSKIQSIAAWPAPRNVKEVQQFLGLANYYRRFVVNYAKLTQPLTALTRKGVAWTWDEDHQTAFESLKQSFISQPVLIHPDPFKPFVVEADASNYAIGAVLSQRDESGDLHPVAFHSRLLKSPEINYPILDKELLAVKVAFEVWRHHLEGARCIVEVLSDHKNLEYFRTAKVESQRHARWSLFFDRFQFLINYVAGKDNGRADALSRRPDYADAYNPEFGQQLLPEWVHTTREPQSGPELVGALVANAGAGDEEEEGNSDSDDNDQGDEDSGTTGPAMREPLDLASESEVMIAIHMGMPEKKLATMVRDELARFPDLKFDDTDLLWFGARLYVPPGRARTLVLEEQHNSQVAGHPGRAKTRDLVSRLYWWPSWRKDTELFVDSCDSCQRFKPSRQRPCGLLEPLPIPARPWGSVSADFIVGLPESEGMTCVMTVVDRLTKMAHFIPLPGPPTAHDMANVFIKQIVRIHGLPDDMVSDRGSQFVSAFWRELCRVMSVKLKHSTSYHPETDGQSERVNQVLEHYLRPYLDKHQNTWVSLLPFAEMAYNNARHESTGKSPFVANFGLAPRFTLLPRSENTAPGIEAVADHLRDVQEELRQRLEVARERYKEQADQHRREAPVYQVGQRVWLSTRNLKSKVPSAKLGPLFVGPFKVVEVRSPLNVKLELPPTMLIHPVFHVSLTKPYVESDGTRFPGRTIPPPEPFELDGETYYLVEKVLDSRIRTVGRRRVLEYHIAWQGYSMEEATWEPNSEELQLLYHVQDFHTLFPDKPGPQHLGGRRRR